MKGVYHKAIFLSVWGHTCAYSLWFVYRPGELRDAPDMMKWFRIGGYNMAETMMKVISLEP